MNSRSYTGIVGGLCIIAGGFSPMLRLPIIGNWNYWDIDLVLASLLYSFAALGVLGAALGRSALMRFGGWASLILLIFTLIAVYFKVNDYFSFIPFKKLAAAASRMVKYQWTGWVMIAVGAFLLLFAARRKAAREFRQSDLRSE